MPLPSLSVPPFISSLIDGQYALITTASRSIGMIIPNVTLEEAHTDVLRVTDHPVEVGAAISDHAFKMPCEVVMQVGWSDSTGDYEGYSASIYSELLSLQALREPFDVSTGKRLYQNMLIGLLHMKNTEETEHALICTVGMREVLITSTSGGGGNGAGAGTTGQQTNPEISASPSNNGGQQLQSTPSTTPSGSVTPGTGFGMSYGPPGTGP